jgi:hypothetical protein
MEKGKGLFSGLRSRRNTRFAANMDDDQQIEDGMIYQAEAFDVCTTRWKDPTMLMELHIEEQFVFFLERTKLDGFASRPYKTFAGRTRETTHVCTLEGKSR